MEKLRGWLRADATRPYFNEHTLRRVAVTQNDWRNWCECAAVVRTASISPVARFETEALTQPVEFVVPMDVIGQWVDLIVDRRADPQSACSRRAIRPERFEFLGGNATLLAEGACPGEGQVRHVPGYEDRKLSGYSTA